MQGGHRMVGSRGGGAVGHLRDGDAGVMTSTWSSCFAGERSVTRVCLNREARHTIASVELLTRMSTCARRHMSSTVGA